MAIFTIWAAWKMSEAMASHNLDNVITYLQRLDIRGETIEGNWTKLVDRQRTGTTGAE